MADCITFCSDIPPAEFPSSLEQNCVVLTRREKPREIEALNFTPAFETAVRL